MAEEEYSDEDANFESAGQLARELQKKDPAVRMLLENMAKRERDPSSTSINRIAKIIAGDKSAAIRLAKTLHEAGFGEYKVGRRGGVSRFEWYWSAISLGQVAAGTSDEIRSKDPNAVDEMEPAEREALKRDKALSEELLTLTIPQAKEALERVRRTPIRLRGDARAAL